MNKKGFTLIELLAVIIILGILMIIAIPSVTKYISDSRKSAYVDTAKQVANATKNLVNSGKIEMYNTNITYFVPSSCIKIENGEKAKSPYGDFIADKTYVVVTYDGVGFNYYWVSLDEAGIGVKTATSIDKLDESLIETDLTPTDINTSLGIDGRKNIRIYNADCSGYIDDVSQMPFSLTSGKSSLEIGDEVCIDTECFNIIAINGDNITLLAKHNLYVGKVYNTSHSFIRMISESDPNYLKQVPEELISDGTNYVYGATEYSSTNYWNKPENTYPMNIYDPTKNTKPTYNNDSYISCDSNCSIIYFVQEYEKVLRSKGASITEVRLPNKNDISSLSDKSFIQTSEGAFWIGTASNSDSVNIFHGYIGSFRYTAYSTTGVRIVVEIKKSSIK